MGGCFTIATAYAGTNDNTITQRLLHLAVSDVSDDVRRTAVTALGFLLLRCVLLSRPSLSSSVPFPPSSYFTSCS